MNYDQGHRIAVRLLTRHDHNRGDLSPLTRENCGACILNGYHPRGEKRNNVNYAGWARVYIQAGKPIESNLFMAFLGELASDNRSYADCLRDDIKHYGIKAAGKNASDFIGIVNEVCRIY